MINARRLESFGDSWSAVWTNEGVVVVVCAIGGMSVSVCNVSKRVYRGETGVTAVEPTAETGAVGVICAMGNGEDTGGGIMLSLLVLPKTGSGV